VPVTQWQISLELFSQELVDLSPGGGGQVLLAQLSRSLLLLQTTMHAAGPTRCAC
jgi:hypothetical protein